MGWIHGLLAVTAIIVPVSVNMQTVHLVKADLAEPFGVAFDAKGNLLIIEYTSSLRAITPAGRSSRFAATGRRAMPVTVGPRSQRS
jgi:hypothetical protein